MFLSDRMKKVQEYYDKNPSKFAIRIGHDRSETIRNVISGKTSDPKASLINDVLRACPEVNAHWLITGVGSMLKEKKSSPVIVEEAKGEYGFCMSCMKKDVKIQVLTDQLKEQEKKNDNLLKEVGGLKNELDNLGGSNGNGGTIPATG